VGCMSLAKPYTNELGPMAGHRSTSCCLGNGTEAFIAKPEHNDMGSLIDRFDFPPASDSRCSSHTPTTPQQSARIILEEP